MNQLLRYADDVLRCRDWIRATAPAVALQRLALLIFVFGMFYGAVMGSFGGFGGAGRLQIVYSAVKVPLLLLVTFAICLPSFYVINSLFGLRRDFLPAMRALVAAQAGIAIILASLAPLTAFWYASDANYARAVLFNAAMFAVASLTGQAMLRRAYQPLIARNEKHGRLLWGWIFLYALVGIQMGWVLRPFIGSRDAAVQFLRPSAWDNAYVVVGRLIWRTVTGAD